MDTKNTSVSMTAADQKLIAQISKAISRKMECKFSTTQIVRLSLRSLAKELGL